MTLHYELNRRWAARRRREHIVRILIDPNLHRNILLLIIVVELFFR